MKHLFGIFLVIFISASVSDAQIIKGKITDKSGEPIRYSTVYIQELKQGTTSNIKGYYEIKLPPGKYTIIYQSLGFEPVYAGITLTDKTIVKDVVLQVQYYEIPEVRVTASGEDPAYIIMRKVIGMAPYYLNSTSYYKADVYLKGNLLIRKIPRLIQKSMKIETSSHSASVSSGGKQSKDTRTIKAGDSFMMESYNEIEFTAPDRYFQKVISVNSTFPSEGDEISPMDYIQASFYQPVIADLAISPLSPAAFSHYNFKYMGATMQGDFAIDKIQVIPKRKSQQLFEGTIYIIEDLWCLHSVDLTNENIVGKLRVQQLYIPVQEGTWMPVSHKFDINLEIIGFKADVGYTSSVKYVEVKPNIALKKPSTISTDYTGKQENIPVADHNASSDARQQIDKIIQKDELSNRDMIKMARLMEKESKNSLPDSIKNSLEVKDKVTHVIEKDANKKDSTYWAEIRPIPLTEIDMKSIKVRDSIKGELLPIEHTTDTLHKSENNKKNTFLGSVKNTVFGHTWFWKPGLSLTFGGLLNTDKLSFNTVDGFVYGTDFRFTKTWENKNSLSFYPDIRWAFSREQLMWRLSGNYSFNKMKQKQIFFRTGVESTDIGNGGSINTLINSATSLLLQKNYLKLYESRFVRLGYRTEIVNGLNLESSFGVEDRRILSNNTDFSLFDTSEGYSDNIPDNDYLKPGSDPVYSLRDQRHADFITDVTYTPEQRYRINNGVKTPEGSDWPTLKLRWKHSVNEYSEMSNRYRHSDMIMFEATKQRDLGAFSEINWKLRTGGYLDNRRLTYFDFFHFNSQSFPLLINDYHDAFMVPSFYSLSTPEFFCEAHLKYTTPYLLFKYLPGLSNTLMRENITFSYLGSRYHMNYTEIGYSISEIFFIGEAGVYVGFEDVKYMSTGVRFTLRFN
ncbi:MAG TPA: DUF5686 and carboxypeptidase regulatory-like domain-containing protein [Bacteroidales bacterium]|nr:DUF5686 and carboxypeptidase regulatory-like domain-containing protein [Bacteroidales bacterium]